MMPAVISAALITYCGLLSLFPLLLASTVLGLVLSGDPYAQQLVVSSALRWFPVIGDQLSRPERLSGGPAGLVVGSSGALCGGLGDALAWWSAMNIIWSVPRNNRPNLVRARGRALVLLGTVGLAVLLTTGLSAVSGGAGALGLGLRVLSLLAAVVVNIGAFIVGFPLATAGALSVCDVLPGAVVAAVAWQRLQLGGKSYVTREDQARERHRQPVRPGPRADRLPVRRGTHRGPVRRGQRGPGRPALPTGPAHVLTDNVERTPGDEKVHTKQAAAQRSKGFEQRRQSDKDAPRPQHPTARTTASCTAHTAADNARAWLVRFTCRLREGARNTAKLGLPTVRERLSGSIRSATPLTRRATPLSAIKAPGGADSEITTTCNRSRQSSMGSPTGLSSTARTCGSRLGRRRSSGASIVPMG